MATIREVVWYASQEQLFDDEGELSLEYIYISGSMLMFICMIPIDRCYKSISNVNALINWPGMLYAVRVTICTGTRSG